MRACRRCRVGEREVGAAVRRRHASRRRSRSRGRAARRSSSRRAARARRRGRVATPAACSAGSSRSTATDRVRVRRQRDRVRVGDDVGLDLAGASARRPSPRRGSARPVHDARPRDRPRRRRRRAHRRARAASPAGRPPAGHVSSVTCCAVGAQRRTSARPPCHVDAEVARRGRRRRRGRRARRGSARRWRRAACPSASYIATATWPLQDLAAAAAPSPGRGAGPR